jgi:hypothetical protein
LFLCITCQDLSNVAIQIFFIELEEDVKKVRGRLMKTEFVILGDWNARISDLQINLPHTHMGQLLHDRWQRE